MAVIDEVIMKGQHIVISQVLKPRILDQLHINHMGIKKSKLLACKSIYWTNINNDIESFSKNCTTCFTFQQTQPMDKIIHHDILVRPQDVFSADMFTLDNKQYLCIVDYHSKFLIIKKTAHLSADNLILMCKITFAEKCIPKKIISDSGSNFISDKFKTLCKNLKIEQAFLSLYHYQSN